jgi:hypothetical protein
MPSEIESPSALVARYSSVPGRIPLPTQILEAEFALNTHDRKLYSKDVNGEIFQIGSTVNSQSEYYVLSDTDENILFIGKLSLTDYPSSGQPEDSEEWIIKKITTNSAGNVTTQQSAQGAWSDKQNLQYT